MGDDIDLIYLATGRASMPEFLGLTGSWSGWSAG
jgi:hypothetical protein